MPHQFELSEVTSNLVRILAALDKGVSITYSELSKLIGSKITSRSGNLSYARHILLRDHAAVWVCIRPGVGLKRLTDVKIAERLPGFWLAGARNKLRRGGSQADVVETKELDIDQQTAFSVASIQRHLAMETLSKATRTRLEKIARGGSNNLPSLTAVEWAIALTPTRLRT